MIGSAHLTADASTPTVGGTYLSMVSASEDVSSKAQTKFTAPPPKFPTERGTTVDSRKIVAGSSSSAGALTAVRINHILFASEDLAESSLNELKRAGMQFDTLASQISNCYETREEGGNVGWMSLNEEGENDHLDLILPREAREEVLGMSKKVSRASSWQFTS
jgi:parvulin-like peptidyl-prolyl isomerase